MSKYDEALISVNYLEQEIVRLRPHFVYSLYDALIKDLIIIRERIEQSQKEHQLLELYREYNIVQENSEFYKRLYTSLLESDRDYQDDYLSYKKNEEDKDRILERIIKLEDALKESESENE